MRLWTNDKTVREKLFQDCVIKLALKLGYLVFHEYDSRRNGTNHGRGFPDLVIVGHGRLLFIELKKHRGNSTTEQRD